MFTPHRSTASNSSHPYSPSSSPPPIELPITRSRTLYYLSIRESTGGASGSRSSKRARKYRNRTEYDADLEDGEEAEGLMGKGRQGDARVNMSIGVGLPPKWVDTTEQVDEILSRARLKLTSLEKHHAKHVLPGFTDRSAEEKEIELQTVDITRDLRRAQSLISAIRPNTRSSAANEVMAAKNVQRALAAKVQDLSAGFRKKQKVYMQKLQGLAVKNKDLLAASGAITLRGAESFDELEDDLRQSASTQLQSQAMSNTTTAAHITKRDQEITQIAKSIAELADLFRDLGNLVVEQGTLLDCVEYNVMETGKELEGAVQELEVAQSYQRNTGRRKCILLLILIILGLIIILIYKPRSHPRPLDDTQPDYELDRIPSSTVPPPDATTSTPPAHAPIRPPRPHPIKTRPPKPSKTRNPARPNAFPRRSQG